MYFSDYIMYSSDTVNKSVVYSGKSKILRSRNRRFDLWTIDSGEVFPVFE